MTPRDDIQGEPKPALTPEEWREFLADGEYPARLRNVIGPDAERCHKAAAKLLHGQPFGFRREHVHAIGYFLAIDTTGDPIDADEWQRNLDLASEAQKLLAALLPPE